MNKNIENIKSYFNSLYVDDYKLLNIGGLDVQIILVSKSLDNRHTLKLHSNKKCDFCSFISDTSHTASYMLNQKYQIISIAQSIFKENKLVIDTKHYRRKDIEKVKDMLSIAHEYENSYVFCDGISFPDGIKRHFYLNIINKKYFPIIEDIANGNNLDSFFKGSTGEVLMINNHLRAGIVIKGMNYEWVFHVYLEIEKLLGRSYSLSKYPFVNCLAYLYKNQFHLIIFPRVVHKPTQYYDNSSVQIKIIPGALEMSGVFIMDSELSFRNLNNDSVKSVFEQISYSFTHLKELMHPLKQKLKDEYSL